MSFQPSSAPQPSTPVAPAGLFFDGLGHFWGLCAGLRDSGVWGYGGLVTVSRGFLQILALTCCLRLRKKHRLAVFGIFPNFSLQCCVSHCRGLTVLEYGSTFPASEW